jgi:cytochrome b561
LLLAPQPANRLAMATISPSQTLALERYSTVAIWLHWTIAALVGVNLLLGFYHEDFARPVRAWMMLLHRSIGISVLILTLARLAWRLAHRPPALDAVLKKWEAGLATFVHWLFYFLLIAIPLSGWLLTSTNGKPFSLFGLFQMPLLPLRGEDAHELLEEVHEIMAKAMIGLILLHIAGALKHHLEGHRHLIERVAPWASKGP